MRVVRRPQFLDDVTDAYSYLTRQSPLSADALLDQIERVIALLAEFPDIGRPRSDLRPGLRSIRIRRFAHILYYRRTDDAVVLLRLLHAARNTPPGTIQG